MAVVACACLAVLVSGCSAGSRPTPSPSLTATAFESPTHCPLVTDADLSRLNPVLKRAGDDWKERNGSIYCAISFGIDLGAIVISGKEAPKPFELLIVSVLRSADFPRRIHLPVDQCTHPGYAHIGECVPERAIGDYAFYTKTLGFPKAYVYRGQRFVEISSEMVRAISGPYEILVDAEYWKGGSPKQGAIELAKKLAARYH